MLDKPMARSPLRSAMALGLFVATTVGCHKAPPPPPDVSGFRITDKFFDVKAIGEKSFLLLGYRSQMARSDDGGQSWKMLKAPAKRSFTRFTFVDGQKGWGVGHEGLIYVTENAAETWTEQTSGTKFSLFDVRFTSPTNGWAVGDLSTTVHTTDGGKTWTAGKIQIEVNRELGVTEDMSLAITDPIFYGVDFVDENTGFIGGEFGQIRGTTDGGQTWKSLHKSLLTGKFRDIMGLPTWLCIRFKDAQNGIAVGTYGAIVSTSDGGTTWKFNESPVPTPLYDIRWLPDGDAIVVGSSGVVLRGNPEAGWKPAVVPAGVFSWISSVDFDKTGNGVAGGAHGLLLTSKDFGKVWEWKVNSG